MKNKSFNRPAGLRAGEVEIEKMSMSLFIFQAEKKKKRSKYRLSTDLRVSLHGTITFYAVVQISHTCKMIAIQKFKKKKYAVWILPPFLFVPFSRDFLAIYNLSFLLICLKYWRRNIGRCCCFSLKVFILNNKYRRP